MRQKLILHNCQSPGDVVILTAAIRDLHKLYPNKYQTDVRTPCPAIWEFNPYIEPIDDDDSDKQTIYCDYPLIHKCNQSAYHFIHGFHQFLSETLSVQIAPTEFKGDIYISGKEKTWFSQVREIVGLDLPFWIIVAGGKYDFTIKWWETSRFQGVVDRLRGKVAFIQVGESNEHYHPPLKGVIDLRGKTDLRQLIRLVHHSSGVLCPVTQLMHLAAAVEARQGEPVNRPCVVVAGGREPPHWEAYPHHQFLHTVGALDCCKNGGCWKSRTKALGDGAEMDLPRNLCSNVVNDIPKCMDMITVDQVVRAIELYHEWGICRYLSTFEFKTLMPFLS